MPFVLRDGSTTEIVKKLFFFKCLLFCLLRYYKMTCKRRPYPLGTSGRRTSYFDVTVTSGVCISFSLCCFPRSKAPWVQLYFHLSFDVFIPPTLASETLLVVMGMWPAFVPRAFCNWINACPAFLRVWAAWILFSYEFSIVLCSCVCK